MHSQERKQAKGSRHQPFICRKGGARGCGQPDPRPRLTPGGTCFTRSRPRMLFLPPAPAPCRGWLESPPRQIGDGDAPSVGTTVVQSQHSNNHHKQDAAHPSQAWASPRSVQPLFQAVVMRSPQNTEGQGLCHLRAGKGPSADECAADVCLALCRETGAGKVSRRGKQRACLQECPMAQPFCSNQQLEH